MPAGTEPSGNTASCTTGRSLWPGTKRNAPARRATRRQLGAQVLLQLRQLIEKRLLRSKRKIGMTQKLPRLPLVGPANLSPNRRGGCQQHQRDKGRMPARRTEEIDKRHATLRSFATVCAGEPRENKSGGTIAIPAETGQYMRRRADVEAPGKQRSEVRGQKSEVRSQRSEVGSQISDLRPLISDLCLVNSPSAYTAETRVPRSSNLRRKNV